MHTSSEASKRWANQLNDLRDRWKIRREKSTPTEWMPVKDFTMTLFHFSKDQLVSMQVELQDILEDVNRRIGNAKSRVATSQKYLNPTDFREMEQVRSSIVLHIMAVQARLSELKQARKQDFPSVFMDVARDWLSEDDFEAIKNEAFRRINQ
jgi:hypothetical protein